MSKPDPDDFEAVRAIVTALQPFQRDDQERILRWAREKIGISAVPPAAAAAPAAPAAHVPPAPGVTPPAQAAPSTATNIKTFIAEKNPQGDTHFAATVAYYYQFQAPEGQRKDAITSDDLQDACRLASRTRLKRPIATLSNALRDGLLDKAERGAYKLNSVGENLVAMALPSATGTVKRRPAAKARKAKKAKK